jgi:hypothetical protein
MAPAQRRLILHSSTLLTSSTASDLRAANVTTEILHPVSALTSSVVSDSFWQAAIIEIAALVAWTLLAYRGI